MLTSYQYLSNCLDLKLRSVKRYWMCQMKCSMCSPALFTHACKRLRKFRTAFATGFWRTSFQIFCNVVWSSTIVGGFSLACRRLLAWRPTHNSQQRWPLHHVSALATSEFEVCLPVKLYARHWRSTTGIQNLSTTNCQLKHKYFVYNYKFHVTITSHWRSFGSWFEGFLRISTWMRILMLEMCWYRFNK